MGSWNETRKRKLKFNNGREYEGDFTLDKIEGEGTIRYPTGYYIGGFVNGKREGKGCYAFTSGLHSGDHFEVEFHNDKKHGHGVYKWAGSDGAYYDGGWFEDKKHGYGKWKDFDGNYYEGYFANDKKHGKGIEKIKLDNIIYETTWVNNKKQGKGVRTKDGERIRGKF